MRRLPILRISLLPGLLTACASGGRALDQERMPAAPDRVGFSTKGYRAGQWVSYETVRGFERWTEKKAVVGQEGDALWIELSEISGGVSRITALLVDPAGKVLRAYYGDPGREGVPMPIVAAGGSTDEPEPRVDTEESDEEVHAAGKVFACRKVASTARHADGSVRKLMTWYSPKVPFATTHDGKPYGGLVKLEGTSTRKILTGFGNDAKPELPHP